MKAKELIYNLRTNLEQAESQLKDATDQHIMFMLDAARAKLASQKLDAKVSINLMSQVLDVTPVKTTLSEIGTVGDAAVIKVPVPTPVMYKNGEAILTVGATDGQDSYSRITFSQIRTALYRKYTASSPKWFWLNGAIYIINREMDSSSKVRVRGIFDEPYKVIQARGEYRFLDPFNWEYPLTLKDEKTVYDLAVSGEMGWGDLAAQAIQAAKRKSEEHNNQMNAQVQ